MGIFRTAATAASILAICSATSVWAGDTTVEDYPDTPTVVEYDPDEGKPAGVADDEDGLATAEYTTEGSFGLQNTEDGVAVTNHQTSVGVAATTTLPDDADQDLKDHEAAHHTLFKEEYDANAKKKLDAAMNGFIGMTFTGQGQTQQEKQDDAAQQAEDEYNKRLDRALAAIAQQGQTVGEKFDKLTEHGTGTSNDTSEGKPLDTDAGLDETRAEKAKAPDAGKQAYIPNQISEPYVLASVGLDVDDATDMISLSGTASIAGGVSALDPVLGAEISISDLIYIGMLNNGAGLVSDGALQITDPGSGNVLLDGFLFELAFMPSTIDGFSNMLQGYLDVPPIFAGGVDPTGSEFLSALDATSSDPNNLSMFYYLFDDPLPMDGDGNLTTTALTGTIKIGIAPVPVPAGLPLLLAAGVLLIRVGRRGAGRRAVIPDYQALARSAFGSYIGFSDASARTRVPATSIS